LKTVWWGVVVPSLKLGVS